jgi:hypothetical protein
VKLDVVHITQAGFEARAEGEVPLETWCTAVIRLGHSEVSQVLARARLKPQESFGEYSFEIGEPDLVWRKFVAVLYAGSTHGDMVRSTQFLSKLVEKIFKKTKSG